MVQASPSPALAHTPPYADRIASIAGLSALAGRYDLVFCDVWGVLHDGITAFADAGLALTRLRESGSRIVLVSNAPRPGEIVARQLDSFDVPRSAYDAIVTSGDVTRAAIAERPGETLFHLGPARDLPLFEGLPVAFADMESAGYCVCTGLFDDEVETVADYAPMLDALRQRDVLMVCANPDIVVERGAALIPCAGAIAAAYELVGGRTLTGGKPHRPIYEAALETGEALVGRPVERARVLAIGDALRTDVAGGRGFDIATLLVARGIHAEELGYGHGAFDAVAALAWLEKQPVRPDLLIPAVVW